DNTLGGKTSIVDGGGNALDDDTATPIDTGLRHESASCELHALIGERRAASGAPSTDRAIRTAVPRRDGPPAPHAAPERPRSPAPRIPRGRGRGGQAPPPVPCASRRVRGSRQLRKLRDSPAWAGNPPPRGAEESRPPPANDRRFPLRSRRRNHCVHRASPRRPRVERFH